MGKMNETLLCLQKLNRKNETKRLKKKRFLSWTELSPWPHETATVFNDLGCGVHGPTNRAGNI